MDDRKVEGLRMEGIVADELARRGYRIVARNYTKPMGELDIVAIRDRELVVCEVRSRCGADIDDAADSVGPTKRHRIRQITEVFLQDFQGAYDEVRFFVAAVAVGQDGVRFEIFEDAF